MLHWLEKGVGEAGKVTKVIAGLLDSLETEGKYASLLNEVTLL